MVNPKGKASLNSPWHPPHLHHVPLALPDEASGCSFQGAMKHIEGLRPGLDEISGGDEELRIRSVGRNRAPLYELS